MNGDKLRISDVFAHITYFVVIIKGFFYLYDLGSSDEGWALLYMGNH